MSISPETLNAFIADTLSEEERATVAQEIARDPDALAYVEDQKAVKAALESSFVVWLRGVAGKAKAGGSWVTVSAMMAGIVLGVALAASYGLGTDVLSEGGTLVAQGPLASALSNQLRSDQEYAAPVVKITESFVSTTGSFCRSFTTGHAHLLSGIACRDGNAWHIPVLSDAAPTVADVAPEMPPSVRSMRETLIAGEPLSDEAEEAARYQRWRPR